MMEQWQNHISISNAKLNLTRLSVRLICAAHWMACIWGMVGKAYGTRLACEGEKPVWTPYPEDPDPVKAYDGVSWVTEFYDGKDSPDNPCYPWHLYATSLHWSIMTITSIGYGDIVPVRFEEYLIECCCMLCGAITWAFIIGSACGVLANFDPYRVQFEQTMDALNYMLNDQELPMELRYRLREYFRESQHMCRVLRYTELTDQMSNNLKGEVALQTTQLWIRQVWYFANCRRDFVIQIAQSLSPQLYATREVFPSTGVLYILERGLCARGGHVLIAGGTWGEDMILESKTLLDTTSTIALTYCEVWTLAKPDLIAVCAMFPRERKRIRQATVKLAVIRGTIKLAQHFRFEHRLKAKKNKFDLGDVALRAHIRKLRKKDKEAAESSALKEQQKHAGGSASGLPSRRRSMEV